METIPETKLFSQFSPDFFCVISLATIVLTFIHLGIALLGRSTAISEINQKRTRALSTSVSVLFLLLWIAATVLMLLKAVEIVTQKLTLEHSSTPVMPA